MLLEPCPGECTRRYNLIHPKNKKKCQGSFALVDLISTHIDISDALPI